ncbi:hypothetical protein ABGF49_07335 [Helcococcus ovis]|uniref:hypothetical protein n=1 Tax=Helcococcus TaxID=31983 RepID=UPI0038BA1525
MDFIKGKLKNGFEYKIDKESFNDYELLELFSEVENNKLIIVKIVNKIFGKQKETLLNFLRDENGKVSINSMEEAMTEIFTSVKEIKN